jgi:glucosylglycerate phosphorylase
MMGKDLMEDRIRPLLVQIYGEEVGAHVFPHLSTLLDRYRPQLSTARASGLTERDAVLITYPDQIQEHGRPALQTLADFCRRHLKDMVTIIHLLPFYPWSSDDGFSVVDYRSVAPQYGGWKDVESLGSDFRLMFDAVINHASVQSSWFQGFLRDNPAYRDYFIELEGNPDLSRVVRPRALPLLTSFESETGAKPIWTTFSADQADLNYRNPEVLQAILEILLYYVGRGARFLRLDAIAYLWKEVGTSCINLPQTHMIVRLIRAVLDDVAPDVMLVTETNVAHAENVSYFGDGTNEAQMVYNFTLPPLVLHAFLAGEAETLSNWAGSLRPPSGRATFLNFLASHDGIGLNPLRGILPDSRIEDLVQRVGGRGGLVSNKSNPDGTRSAYELNVNYLDALEEPASGKGPDMTVDRFVAAHAILLALAGVPAIYFHSLFGSRGWPEGVAETGRNRSINRQKLERAGLERDLARADSLRGRVFDRISRLSRVRSRQAAFDPYGRQRVLDRGRGVFALLRQSPGEASDVLCLQNVTAAVQSVRSPLAGTSLASCPSVRDLVGDRPLDVRESSPMELLPYQTVWLKGENQR